MIKNVKKYFSIIELLATFAVISVLMSIGIGVYRLVVDKVQETKTRSLIKKIEMAMRSYQHETGYYFQKEHLGSLIINENDEEFRKLIDYTAMISRGDINNSGEVIDVWGNPVMYECPGSKNTTLFDLGSKGKNGIWGDSTPENVLNFGIGDDITNTNM